MNDTEWWYESFRHLSYSKATQHAFNDTVPHRIPLLRKHGIICSKWSYLPVRGFNLDTNRWKGTDVMFEKTPLATHNFSQLNEKTLKVGQLQNLLEHGMCSLCHLFTYYTQCKDKIIKFLLAHAKYWHSRIYREYSVFSDLFSSLPFSPCCRPI